mgnify:CR=1 FL=1
MGCAAPADVGQKVLDDDRQVRDRITRNIQTDLERIHSVPNTNPRAEEDEVLRSGRAADGTIIAGTLRLAAHF